MRNLLSFLFLLFIFSTSAQNAKIDSLKHEILISKYDSTKIRLLNDLGIQFWSVDLDKSIQFGKQALKLADKNEYVLQKARSYNVIGVAYFHKSELENAYKYYVESIKISENLRLYNDYEKSLVNISVLFSCGLNLQDDEIKIILDKTNKLANIRGISYSVLMVYFGITGKSCSHENNNFDILSYLYNLDLKYNNSLLPVVSIVKALHYRIIGDYFRAIEYANITLKLNNDNIFTISANEILTEVNFALRRFKDAKNNCLEVVKRVKESKDPMILSKLTLNEYMLGVINIELKEFKEAYILIPKNISINMIPYNKAGYYCNMANIYLNLDSLLHAKNFIDKSIQISDSLKIYPQLLAGLNTKFDILTKMQQNSQIPDVIEQIEQTIGEVHEWYSVYEGYVILCYFYKSKGVLTKALLYTQKLMQINDTIKNKELNQSLDELQVKYETEKKEQQIVLQRTELKSTNRLLAISISVGTLVLIALIHIILLYNKRNQAYKRLVYQSINCPNENLVIENGSTNEMEDNDTTLNDNENKPVQLSDEQKTQILSSIKYQLDSKSFLRTDLNINKLAELCNTNRTYLSQVINETYQMNFNAFINKLRIDEAKKMILDRKNDIQLKNLYTELGFNTYNVFNEAFKRHIGVTPAFFVRTINKDL